MWNIIAYVGLWETIGYVGLIHLMGFISGVMLMALLYFEGETCQWTQEDPAYELYNMWKTDCGNMYCLENGTPTDNHMKSCCYCGRKLVERRPR